MSVYGTEIGGFEHLKRPDGSEPNPFIAVVAFQDECGDLYCVEHATDRTRPYTRMQMREWDKSLRRIPTCDFCGTNLMDAEDEGKYQQNLLRRCCACQKTITREEARRFGSRVTEEQWANTVFIVKCSDCDYQDYLGSPGGI